MRHSAVCKARTGITRELGSYIVVGGISFLLDFALLYLLTERVHLHYLLSASLSFSAGLLCNYSLSILFVFQERSLTNRLAEFSIFSTIGLTGLALNAGLLWTFTERLRIQYLAAKIFVAAIVFLWNFSARKIILFTSRESVR